MSMSAYDAAGRMIREGKREYRYGGMDKVTSVLDDGETVAEFAYGADGQLANITRQNGNNERLYWSGLALVRRDRFLGVTDDGTAQKTAGRRVSEFYLNEPHPTGGNPVAMWTNDNPAGREMSVAAATRLLFNDMLGSTLAYLDGGEVIDTGVTLFGETANEAQEKQIFFTGKPRIDELGYAFLFRNYRPEKSKWQTADPLGYPDGWNCMAYCGNRSFGAIDPDGALWSWAAGAIGAGLSVAGYSVSCLFTGDEITISGLAGATAGGFVAGAVAGALIGDPSAVSVSTLYLATTSAVAATTGKVTNNVVSSLIDENKTVNFCTVTDGVLSTAFLGVITSIFPLQGLLSNILAIEVGVVDDVLTRIFQGMKNAFNSVEDIQKQRLLNLEYIGE